MAIPVYINQEQASKLLISQDGLYTILEAEAPATDDLVRLWAHGNGKSAYIGVMQPWSGGLYLRRRLTRRELAAFPDPIEYVSDRERSGDEEARAENDSEHKEVDIKDISKKHPAEAVPDTESGMGRPNDAEDKHKIVNINNDRGRSAGDTRNEHNTVNITKDPGTAESMESAANNEEAADDQTKSLHNKKSALLHRTDARACPWPAEPPEEGLLWYRRGDGSLTAFDGISSLLAVPAELRSKSDRMAERVIEGKKYLVFRY